MLIGALIGLVPIILIVRASQATLLRWWIASLLATLFVLIWMGATLPRHAAAAAIALPCNLGRRWWPVACSLPL